jgi:hypothetical protein
MADLRSAAPPAQEMLSALRVAQQRAEYYSANMFAQAFNDPERAKDAEVLDWLTSHLPEMLRAYEEKLARTIRLTEVAAGIAARTAASVNTQEKVNELVRLKKELTDSQASIRAANLKGDL